jgi:hypothetical protein
MGGINYSKYKDSLLRRITISKNGCWIFTGVKDESGYGRILVGSRKDGSRRSDRAHRVSYRIFRGNIGNLCVLHSCDNPACINPEHLFLGTKLDNSNDKINKNRHPNVAGAKNPNASHCMKEIMEIREKYASGLYSFAKLAKMYNYKGCSSIFNIVHKTHWQPLPAVPQERGETK